MSILNRRIKIVNEEDSTGSLGKTGTVVKEFKDEEVIYYCVKLKDWNEGHYGITDRFSATVNQWYFSRRAFRLLPKKRRLA